LGIRFGKWPLHSCVRVGIFIPVVEITLRRHSLRLFLLLHTHFSHLLLFCGYMVINLARWMELEDFVCFLRDIAWPCTLGGLEFFGLFDEMEGVEGRGVYRI